MLLVFSGCTSEKVSIKPWKNYVKVGDAARDRGDWQEADRNYTLALREAEQFRPDSRRLAYTVSRVGSVSEALHRYDQAEQMFSRRVELDRQRNLTNTMEYVEALLELASARRYAGKYNEAENAYFQAESVVAREFNDISPVLGLFTARRAELYLVQGRLKEAETCYYSSYELIDYMIRGIDPTTWTWARICVESGHTLNGYGLLKARQKKYAEAETLLKRSISRLDHQLGSSNPSLVAEWNNLAAVYAMQGKWADSEKSVNHSLAIIEKNKITGHPAVASTQALQKKIHGRESFSDFDGFFNPSCQIAFLMRKFY